MPLLVKEEIYRDFAFAGAVPQYPTGASQAELRDLYAQDPKGAYVQYCFDRIVAGQDNPLVRQAQSDYPRTPGHIRQMVDRFTPSMWEPLFDQTLGYAPSHRPRPVSVLPIASQTLPEKPSKPELTPEQLEAKLEHERELCRERVRRFRERKRDGDRIAQAEARHDAIAAEEQTRRQTFGAEFAGAHGESEVSPATLKGEDEPAASKGPASWQ